MSATNKDEHQIQYKLLFENSFEGMIVLEQDGNILEANQHMADMVGFGVDEMVGMNVFEFMLPVERGGAVDRTQKASIGQALPMVERTIIRKDGSRFIGEANLSPIMDEDGNLLYLLGILRDLTERKQLEEALIEKEAQLRQIGDNLPDGMIYRLIHTPDGQRSVSYISQGVDRMYGVPMDEVLQDINILYGMMLPEDLEAVILAEEESIENQDRFEWEGRFLLQNGELRWSRYHSKPTVLPDGTRIWDGVALDITDQKQQEEKDRLLLILLDTLDGVCYIKDREGIYRYINKAFETQFGVKREDVVGKDDVFVFGPESAKMMQKNDRRIMRSQQSESIEETGLVNGELKTYLSNKTPFVDKNDDISGICGVGVDITEQKQVEEKLKLSEQRTKALLNASTEVALLTELDGKVVAGNQALADSLRANLSDLVGKNIFDYFPRDIAQARRTRSEEVAQFGKPIQFEDTRNGRWFRNILYPIMDEEGRASQLAVFAHDITERKSLHQISRELTNISDLPATLDCVCGIVETLFDAKFVSIAITHEDEQINTITQSERTQQLPEILPLSEMPVLQEMIERGISYASTELKTAPSLPEIRAWARKLNLHSVLLTPLVMRGDVFGFLLISSDQKNRAFSKNEIALAETISSDIASAIENARLFSLVHDQAVADERVRIARELHDSVTQTMYSVSMVAEALPRLLDRNLDEAKRRAIHLRQMTLGALAEMRNLLFEFHPKALRDTRLSILLQQLSDVLTGRTRIPVKHSIKGDTRLPEQVKVAFYRVAQEAFNNIAKHASATEVTLDLQTNPNECRLSIQDNGIGFSLDSVDSERLGLKIMRERAEEIDANLVVESSSNRGTQVSLVWSSLPLEKSL